MPVRYLAGMVWSAGLVVTSTMASWDMYGRPVPTVSWFINDRISEGQIESIGHHVIVNRLEVPRVRRQHLNSTYKCQASNTKLMMPNEKMVRLELLLRPLTVRIFHKPRQLVADTEYVVTCEAAGSRPKAHISWYRDNRKFRRGKQGEEMEDSTLTILQQNLVSSRTPPELPLHLLLNRIYGALELPKDRICGAYLLPSWRLLQLRCRWLVEVRFLRSTNRRPHP
ncbi:hypothetical protein CBL_07978 [Carabus blaptoides fortunei]